MASAVLFLGWNRPSGGREGPYSMVEVLAAEYPAIPLVHYGTRALVKPYVQGFEPDRVLGLTPLKKVSLSDAR